MLWSRARQTSGPSLNVQMFIYCIAIILCCLNDCLKDKNTEKDVTEKGCPSLMYKCFNVSLCARYFVS